MTRVEMRNVGGETACEELKVFEEYKEKGRNRDIER